MKKIFKDNLGTIILISLGYIIANGAMNQPFWKIIVGIPLIIVCVMIYKIQEEN